MEGLWNGVPSLVADGEYSGGMEYLGPFANTFKAGDYEDFKKQFKNMWDNPPEVDIEKAREYIKTNFSFDAFAKRIKEGIDQAASSDTRQG